MSLGRPAMRGREARKIAETLKKHKQLMDTYIALDGMTPEAASAEAFKDIQLLKMADRRVRPIRRAH